MKSKIYSPLQERCICSIPTLYQNSKTLVIWFYFLFFPCGSYMYAHFMYEHFCRLSATDNCRMQLLFPDQLFMYKRVRPRCPGCGCAGCCVQWPTPPATEETRGAAWASSLAVNVGQATSASALCASSCCGIVDVLQKPTCSDYSNLAQTWKGCVLPAGSQSRVLKAHWIHHASCSRVQEQADPIPSFSWMSCV